MNPVDIILTKRRGGRLSAKQIEAFVRGATDSSFADYQLAALLMAICINGMDEQETVDLTMSMARSGDMLDLSSVRGVKVDKHSTGGVGDTTTLILAPLVAACGLTVAKMSGRGLGHTGGTLDKLESIPGFNVSLDTPSFISQLNRVGCAVIGQTANLAPADKALYALRDVTGTVDSLPLVVSSILSKKLAAGCDAVVLDVKTGSGAIMPTLEKSVELAEEMVRIGARAGRKFAALVTDMDQPLGMYIGNALEVEEAIRVLSNQVKGPLRDVSLLLGAYMLLIGGRAKDLDGAMRMIEAKLESGEGLEKLGEMISEQGGDRRVIYDTALLPHTHRRVDIPAGADGYLARVHTSLVGEAARALGAGRMRKEDTIDPAVGIIMKKRLGERVTRGEPLCQIHFSDASDLDAAREMLNRAFETSARPVAAPKLIHRVIAPDGLKGQL